MVVQLLFSGCALNDAPSIQAGDSLNVVVSNEPELSGIFPVSKSGEIDFPLIGKVAVAGLGKGQVKELLAQKLEEGFMRSPQVSVK